MMFAIEIGAIEKFGSVKWYVKYGVCDVAGVSWSYMKLVVTSCVAPLVPSKLNRYEE
jgi:hypothetical protein